MWFVNHQVVVVVENPLEPIRINELHSEASGVGQSNIIIRRP